DQRVEIASDVGMNKLKCHRGPGVTITAISACSTGRPHTFATCRALRSCSASARPSLPFRFLSALLAKRGPRLLGQMGKRLLSFRRLLGLLDVPACRRSLLRGCHALLFSRHLGTLEGPCVRSPLANSGYWIPVACDHATRHSV